MELVNLISEKYIKENSTIDENVDVKLVMPFVRMAQDKYIEKLLTKPLINEIYEQARDKFNFTPANKELVKFHIAPCLLWYVIKEATPFLLYKYRNKSISTQGSDNATPIADYEMEKLTSKANDTANSYAYRLTEYLFENRDKYPLYKCPQKPIGDFNINFKNKRSEKKRFRRY